ncbi:hypothetical protein DSO57_1036800 [Entomophthora muscae]|uniref:Uncharacterized protein n=1 Tax=Entomophthora muscae TaxID=34485 RepID=A0ACC2RQB9_9FUNG|nr:hypothetical protein DSO57_1036800 [Entomophthora muscae]
MEGLMAYGSSPELIFNVPVGISHLSGPCAFGTIAIHENIKPADTPTWPTVCLAKEDPFLAQFEGSRKACSKCKAMDHSKATCPNLNPFLYFTATLLAPVTPWGSTLSPFPPSPVANPKIQVELQEIKWNLHQNQLHGMKIQRPMKGLLVAIHTSTLDALANQTYCSEAILVNADHETSTIALNMGPQLISSTQTKPKNLTEA